MRGKKKTAKQLSRKQQQGRNTLRKANERIRKLESMKAVAQSPAYNVIVNQLRNIYGGKLPKGKKVGFYVSYLPNDKNRKIREKALVASAKHFLSLPTSTVEGVQEKNQKRDAELKRKYGFDDEELKNYYDIASEVSAEVDNYSLGSDLIYQQIADVLNETDGEENMFIKQAIKIMTEELTHANDESYPELKGLTVEHMRLALDVYIQKAKNSYLGNGEFQSFEERMKNLGSPYTKGNQYSDLINFGDIRPQNRKK